MSTLNDLSPLVYSAKILQLITTEPAKWAVLSKHLSYVDDLKHALELSYEHDFNSASS